MKTSSIPPDVQADLEQIEAIIGERVRSQPAVVHAAGRHLTAGPDGRLRAAIVLMSARLGQFDLAKVVHAAAAVELIHAATSVHDELIDEADRRRGVIASNDTWGGDVALMVGDYLFALAAAEMSLSPDPRIIAYYSRSVMAICEGQLAPVVVVTPLEQAREQYIYRIERTTAALFEAACKAGMVCGAGTDEQVESIGRFGYNFGMALRLTSHGREYELADGALLAESLRVGRITLPLIYAVEASGDPALVASLDLPSDERIGWVVDQVRSSGGVARALADAQRYAQAARHALAAFPAGPYRAALERLVDDL